jgi:antitoxin (DNA-binding transcriptional repressor) of toxin-antitoxin stability system
MTAVHDPKNQAMSTVTLEEAQAHLSELVEQLIPGEEMAITRGPDTVAVLVAPRKLSKRRVPGLMRGKLAIVSGDDEHLKDFAEYQ